MSSPVANGDAGVIFNCPALTELYGVTASQSLPDGRYVVSAAWRCGGTSGKLQAADGVKASVSLCAILCGIVPSFPTPNVMEPQGISQIPADPTPYTVMLLLLLNNAPPTSFKAFFHAKKHCKKGQ